MSDGIRWYDKDGKIVTVIKGKNGKDREPNIKDARENNFAPSVTSILGLANKPALTQYFIREALKAAYNNQWALEKQEKEAIAILSNKAKEEGEKAAKFGSKIHGYIETFLKSKSEDSLDIDANIVDFVVPVFDYLLERDIKGHSEEAIIIEVDGMRAAGTVDNYDDLIIRDFKTQKTSNGKFTLYDSWIWQLGGYNIKLKKDKGEVIAISSTEAKAIKSFSITKEQLDWGSEIFTLLLKFFYLSKNLS